MFISKELPQALVSVCQDILDRRACATAAACLCMGILAGRRAPLRDPSLPLVAVLLALVILWLTARNIQAELHGREACARSSSNLRAAAKAWSFLLGIGFFLFALGFFTTRNAMLMGADFDPSSSPCSIYATVSKTLGTGEGFRILLVERGYNYSENRILPGQGRLFLRNNDIRLSAGDTIAFRSRVRKPLNRDNPGEFDWAGYCRNEGIMWLASVSRSDGVLLIRRGMRWYPPAILFDLRESMRLFLDAHSGRSLTRWIDTTSAKDVRTFLKAIVLGDRSEISHTVRSSFADSGLAHALSASGVHVAIVVLLTLITVKLAIRARPAILLWIPLGKITALASIPVMITYCMLVGAGAPAVRSTIMGVVFALAVLSNRRWDSFNSLIVAGFVILLLYPLSLFAVDFQLSFVAVAGILLVAPPMLAYMKTALATEEDLETGLPAGDKAGPVRRWMVGSVLVVGTSLGATLAVTPLVLQFFHSFPVYTLLANVLADSLLTVALFFGLAGSVIGLCAPSLGALVLFPADVSSYLTLKLAAAVSAMPYSTVKVRHLTSPELLALWALVCCVIWGVRKPGGTSFKAIGIALCCLVATVGLSLWVREQPALKVTFLNVGKADAAFVEPRGARGLLVDGGLRNEYFDSGPSIILPFLWWNGNGTLDGMIISHPQMDHMGGLLSVIPHARPGYIWWNPVEPRPGFVTRIMTEARKVGSKVLPADRRRPPVTVGTAIVRFLNKPSEPGVTADPHGLNDASVVCAIQCGHVSFLFTGDMEVPGEEELLASGIPLAADVLKVGHHGSRTSTSRRFVEAVQPKVAIISSDFRLARGGPGKEVIDRLLSAGSKVFWTGRDGAVIVQTDGQNVSVSTVRRDRDR